MLTVVICCNIFNVYHILFIIFMCHSYCVCVLFMDVYHTVLHIGYYLFHTYIVLSCSVATMLARSCIRNINNINININHIHINNISICAHAINNNYHNTHNNNHHNIHNNKYIHPVYTQHTRGYQYQPPDIYQQHAFVGIHNNINIYIIYYSIDIVHNLNM